MGTLTPTPRWLALAAWIVGLLLLVATLRQAWLATWSPTGIPTFDVADYVLRAHDLADALRAGDLAAWGRRFLTPDLHPPLHPALVGLVFAVGAPTMAAACTVAFIELAVAMGMLVVLGRRADLGAGAAAGLVAAVLTSASLLHRGLATSPMTEPLSLVAVLGTLALALPADGPASRRRAVGVGVAVLAAGLVRYNLVPMLLVPLLLDHALRVLLRRRPWTDTRWIAWIVPTVVGFGVWGWVQPGLEADVRYFFTNNDSGVPLWSAANLRWLPEAFATDVAGVAVLAGLVAVATVGGLVSALRRLRAGEPAGELLVHAFAFVAMAALFVHPFKLERNLYVVAPALYLVAALPVVRLARRHVGVGTVALVASVAAFVVLRGATDARVDAKRSFSEEPELRAALDRVVARARAAERVVIAGAHRDLNEHLFALTLRGEAPGTEVVLQSVYPPDCDAETPPPNVVCTPTEVDRWLTTEGTIFATVEQAGPPGRKAQRGRREGTVRMARDVAQRVATVPGLVPEELDLHRARLKLTIYAPGLGGEAPRGAVEAAPVEVGPPLKGRRRRDAEAAKRAAEAAE
ncbi:MAG: hypothetical protein Q8P41_13460 [Pseudomonadota bacterium]|nr:hypothetical protein [Pseudomonadota bacterium]